MGTGLHAGSLKCIIGNIKEKNGNENNQSIFQIYSEGKRLGKEWMKTERGEGL